MATRGPSLPPAPRSCDTFCFVAGGAHGPAATLFGKNSDRPSEEEHEVVAFAATKHAPGSTVKCTYIQIPQVPETLAVVLSRPAWLWGCEMGANERGVVGGNEAIATVCAHEIGTERRLLGMDLLRLALERGATAHEAAMTCARLLEEHGQGGPCAEDDDGWSYENGFLFADGVEAYILETAGVRRWALEKVAPGTWRNISNGASIRTAVHACSDGLRDECAANGWWDGTSPFDFKASLAFGGRQAARGLAISGRERAAATMLTQMAADAASGALAADDVASWCGRAASILRDEASGICFREVDGFCSTGSMISWICARAPTAVSQEATSHLFTGASDPLLVPYKRFSFARDLPTTTADSGADDVRADGVGGNHSLELWRRWRQMALSRQTVSAALSAQFAEREQATVQAAAHAAARVAAGQQQQQQGIAGQPQQAEGGESFATAVARELELLTLQTSASV